jgi:glycosyltransferase involved in cell wall biosynthesis
LTTYRLFNVRDSFRYTARLLLVRVHPQIAVDIYWTSWANLRDLYDLACAVEADVWLANDWSALPIAARLAKEKGGVYGYDTHEFAAEEYADRWKWRFWNRPVVCALERRFIQNAVVVSAVSTGIAERLNAMYRLPRPSLVIRNTPCYEEASFRPTGERVRVLYHGIITPGRALEAAIDSVQMWRREFSLTIRGPENPNFSDALRARIRERGLVDRVELVPPVPMTELVRAAMPFDVGFFGFPGHSRHNEFVLPNKFFEYAMAGLALCVSDLPEMARLVRQYELGVLIPSVDPVAIATAVNELNSERIDLCKRNSLRAARDLCWERECQRMLDAYGSSARRAAAD